MFELVIRGVKFEIKVSERPEGYWVASYKGLEEIGATESSAILNLRETLTEALNGACGKPAMLSVA